MIKKAELKKQITELSNNYVTSYNQSFKRKTYLNKALYNLIIDNELTDNNDIIDLSIEIYKQYQIDFNLSINDLLNAIDFINYVALRIDLTEYDY